jgi:hypothetical protein
MILFRKKIKVKLDFDYVIMLWLLFLNQLILTRLIHIKFNLKLNFKLTLELASHWINLLCWDGFNNPRNKKDRMSSSSSFCYVAWIIKSKLLTQFKPLFRGRLFFIFFVFLIIFWVCFKTVFGFKKY